MAVEIRMTACPDVPAAAELYRQADWWEEGDSMQAVKKLFAGSFLVAEACDGKCLAGMGRALSDGAGDAYIQNVVVDARYRGQGIGTAIVRILVQELRKRGITWIGLIGAPGTESFYRKIGFEPLKNHIPMRYRGENE